MQSDTELLDEVVVVAYGTATKRSFTGSATEIKGVEWNVTITRSLSAFNYSKRYEMGTSSHLPPFAIYRCV